jgi:hypothetical protein
MVSLIHDNTEAVYAENLNLFKPYLTNVGVLNSELLHVYPQSSLSDQISPFVFKYQVTSHYVELNTHFLYVEARITKNTAECFPLWI